jgi:type I restriction enzyme S subunit
MNAGWPTRKLSDIADMRVSNVDKKTHAVEKPVKLCNYLDVYSNEYVTGGLDFMEASATVTEIERFGLRLGDVVITKDSETPDDIGIAAVIAEQIDRLVCGYHLALIRPTPDQLDSVYLAKQLSTSRVARYFALHSSGSTRYGLPISVIESLSIPTPTKLEQIKIADILTTVDRAIEQTKALIAKQQRIKTGLMQDLLTRGIDEGDHLRSDETHAFKDSSLGRIPKHWRVQRIDELLADVDPPMRSGPFGSALLKEELVESGVPLLGIDNVFPEKFVRDYSRFVHPQKAERLRRYRVRPGDIMITIMGTVGRCCVVPEDVGVALSSKHTWTISLNRKIYSPYLACLQVNYAPWVLRHFAKDEQGGSWQQSSRTPSGRLCFPCPLQKRWPSSKNG